MPTTKLASSSLPITDDGARTVLETALADLGESAEQVSVAIEMPSVYLRRYLEHGVPRVLPNRIRRRLASYLGVPDFALG